MAKSTAIVPPNLGLYYGVSAISVPARAVQDGRNFRIKQGKIGNRSLGWTPFFTFDNDSFRKSYLTFEDTADASTIIKDRAFGKSANDAYNWVLAGNAQVDTAQSALGTRSLLLDGTGDWASTPHHANFVFGSGDWAVEQFVRPAANGAIERISGKANAGLAAADTEWYIEKLADNTVRALVSNGSAFTTLTSSQTVLAGAFTFVALCREGNTLRLYVGTALADSDTFTGAVNSVATADLRVGAAGEDTNDPLAGWIDNFSLSVGTSRFSGSTIVPPTQHYLGKMDGDVTLIDTFFIRGASEVQVFGTKMSLYRYDSDNDQLFYISPTYTTGTVAVAGTAVTGTGTLWVTNNIAPGDFITFRGTAPETHPYVQWYEIQAVGGETGITLTAAVTEGGGTIGAGASYTIRRKFTGDIADVWDTEVFVQPDDGTGDDLMFFTNGIDPIVKWDGSAASAIQTLTTIRARRLGAWKNMMLYGWFTLGGDVFPTSFINSDIGKPEDIVNGLAGQFRVHDGTDHLIEMEDLGDNMVFYSLRHTTLAQFVGDPLVFVFRQASSGIGPIAPRLIADFGDYHEFIGADSQYLFDGVAVTEIGKQVWREVLRIRDPSRHFLGYAHFDEENGDLIWAVPISSDAGVSDPDAHPDEAFVEHYLEEVGERVPDPVSRRQMPFFCGGYSVTRGTTTWDELTSSWDSQGIRWNDSFLLSAFPINLMGGPDGQVYILNASQFGNGVALPSFARFGRRTLGDGRQRGLLQRVYPFAVQNLTNNVTIVTRYADHAAGPITIIQSDIFDQSLAEGVFFVTPYRRGRYFELEIQQLDGELWECEGYDTDGAPGGTR